MRASPLLNLVGPGEGFAKCAPWHWCGKYVGSFKRMWVSVWCEAAIDVASEASAPKDGAVAVEEGAFEPKQDSLKCEQSSSSPRLLLQRLCQRAIAANSVVSMAKCQRASIMPR
eukprot:6248674-Amphidinium_carterae.1